MSLIYKDPPRNEYNKIAIYIAGPMRGYPKLNHEAFDKAEKTLESKLVYSHVNPAKIDREFGLTGDVDMTKEELKEALERDVDLIFDVDAL